MKIEAQAKINLSLEVYGLRPDGYHELKSVVLPITLSDTLVIEDAPTLTSDSGIANDLTLKAARALDPRRGAAIHLEKRIPLGSGLGGGSADAAATLIALNELWQLGHSVEALAAIGTQVGSDVPALVIAQHYRVPVLMEGRGEKVTRLKPEVIAEREFVLVNPGVHSSTAEVYRHAHVRTQPAKVPINDLEAAAIALHPEIAVAMAALQAAGAKGVRMSGSGSTVFGSVDSRSSGLAMAASLAAHGFMAWSTAAAI